MLISLEGLELLNKSIITRTEAKAAHKDLPPGGVWRTMHGHHIYIKDGKILAGSVPGVKGAKKATKAQLKEHQANLDAKGTKASGDKKPGKAKDAGKASKPAKQAAGAGNGGKGTKKAGAAKAGAKPTTKKDVKPSKGHPGLENVPEQYRSTINDYINGSADAQKGLTDGNVSKGRCDTVSEGIVNKLNEQGIPARLVEAQGLKTGLDAGASKDWQEFAKDPADLKFMGHTMIQVPEGIIDISGSQFGKKYNGVRMLSMDDFKKEWAGGKINYTKKQRESGMNTKDRHKKLAPMKAPKAKPAKKAEPKASEDGHYEVFHGTKVYHVDSIKENGFELNGNEADFGDAAYFKSPTFDHLDHADQQKKIQSWLDRGATVPDRMRKFRGNDTVEVVNEFTGKEPSVIKATIPKKHVLDCSKGRPKELQDIISDYSKENKSREDLIRLAFKHILGKELPKDMDEKGVREAYTAQQGELQKAWGDKVLRVGSVSPYEIYAKKNGIGAIVDKLDQFEDEGWQIGVYDPKLIQVQDVGKKMSWKAGAELQKALNKASKAMAHAMLGHEMTEEGLIMHIPVLTDGLEKSLTRKDAKAVHKELPPGGEWRTMNGHHIYIKDGKVLAGAVPGATKAKKATKAQLKEHQDTIDKEAKGKKKTPTKGTKGKSNAKTTKVGAEKSGKSTAKPAKSSATKTAKPKGTGRPVQGAGAEAKPAKGGAKGKPAAKKTVKPKDIRTEAQKNRNLAYDVGDKVGGARKDDFEANFKEKPTMANLAAMEKDSGAVAEKMVTKANILPKFDFAQEHKNGVDLPTAILKKLIYDRITPKPEQNTPEGRKAYMDGILKAHRHFAGIKTWENMRNAVREFQDVAYKGRKAKDALNSLKQYAENPNRWSYFNADYHMETAKKGAEAMKFMDFSALGDKFEDFFINYTKREATFKTVQKNMQDGWDKYLNPDTKAKGGGTPKGTENKKWERKAEAEHLRKGGKETKVKKPEDLMKEFGLRGVEFGHWVNDSSGLYHLKRCAEAFDDLSDVLGVDKKDIALNNRLAIAFGARGKGGALAHYEPSRKVINMTKYGGAGSLAHEWGHAMDNILYQYSQGGKDSMGMASEGVHSLGSADPKLNMLYQNLMDAITKPAPGDTGGVKTIKLDSEAKKLTRYYPRMRQQIADGMSPQDVFDHWTKDIHERADRAIASIKANRMGYYKSPADQEKAIKKYEQQRKRETGDIAHYIAHELRLKQNGGKYGGDHYKGTLKMPTGESEYYSRMQELDGDRKGYYAQPAEMFARVFESYVQHKLEKAKRHNNYLVHSTREKDVEDGAPFPKGKEREHMFKAMENLMSHISKGKALTKALMMEILASGHGDMTEELRKSLGYTKRSAYNVANPEEVIYIPLNRLRKPYQTEKATNWDKVQENVERMTAGENLEPIVIGLDYDIHDGHHRYEASHLCDYEHAPCIVKGGNDLERQRAIEAYKEVWKSLGKEAFEDDENFIFRGIGQAELDFVRKHGYFESKGKGNDADKASHYVCFSSLYSQAQGYARSNYDLYNEPMAYVVAIPKPDWAVVMDGEIVIRGRMPAAGMQVIPIPKS